MTSSVSISDIQKAAVRIGPYVHRTPVLTCSSINRLVDAEVFLKCENFQKTGAFKFRGACNAVFSLSESQAARGVVTSSSGNHAQAVALAARLRGIKAFVAMPETAPRVKKVAVAGYGAKIYFCEWTMEALDATAARVAEETGAVFVEPFNAPETIAGQGTAALELLQDVANLDVVMAPVGGGGLLAGTAIAVSGFSPATRVVGAEPATADDACQSLKEGRIVPARPPKTIADGLRTSLGDLTFAVIRSHVGQIVTASEEAIVAAMRYVWERAKIIIEPSAAVPIASLLEKRQEVLGQRIGIILSGGNVDLDCLPWAIGSAHE
jgi:threonine dehydratase